MSLLTASTVAACGSPSSPADKYGGAPSYLPRVTVPVDPVVVASADHPQLAIQGATVKVVFPAGHTLATVVGPVVPPFVAPPPPAGTATFTVTLVQTVGTVRVRVRDFSVADQLGHLDELLVPLGHTAPPATVPDHGALTFELTAVLPTGEGVLHWAPHGKVIASWDFVVEDD